MYVIKQIKYMIYVPNLDICAMFIFYLADTRYNNLILFYLSEFNVNSFQNINNNNFTSIQNIRKYNYNYCRN